MGSAPSTSFMDYYNLRDVLSCPDLVVPELVMQELSGELKRDDYLGQAMIELGHFVPKAPAQSSEEDSIGFEDVSLLLEPGHSKLEHGFVRRRDGSLYIAVHTDLGAISGDLVDWWFCQCDDDEKFRWWHPLSHVSCTFDAPFYAAMPWERPKGHYVDHVQVVEEILDSKKLTIHYEYLRPSRFFDVQTFAESGVTACIVARIHVDDPKWGLVAIGYMVHMVRTVDGKSEMRSRYWLGDIFFAETPENYYYAQAMDSLANSWLARSLKLSDSLAKSLWQQTSQKMACLKEFIKHYHDKTVSDQDAFQRRFDFRP